MPLEAQTGQGRYVMCQLGQGVVTMPPFGARVLVVSPSSYGTMPGASVIVYVLDPSAPDLAPGETCFIPTVGGTRVSRARTAPWRSAMLPQFHAAVSELVDEAVTQIVAAFNTHQVQSALPEVAVPTVPGIRQRRPACSKILKVSG